MNPIISELRTLLKFADTLQDLEYEKKEVERKKTQEINETFFVKKAVIEYEYLKGLEAKSFIVMQTLVTLLGAIVFIIASDFFQNAWDSLIVSLLIGVLVNLWFVLGYKPYKVPDWYLTGALFYGLLLTLFATILLVYASIVFFTDSGPFFLVLFGLINIHLVISYLVGGIFPALYNLLDRNAFKNETLQAALKALEKEKENAHKHIQDELNTFNRKIAEAQKAFDAITVIPPEYKAYKTIKIMIHYLEEKKATSIDEAIELFNQDEQDALRRMTILSV